MADSRPGRLRELRDILCANLIERDEAMRLALLTALAGEHLLIIGPPGTAKSLIARRLQAAFAESAYFERQLTRMTPAEEVFGPYSVKGLEEDRYERLTASYLPTATVAFLDEVFLANSFILNALLTLLDDRVFDNGVTRERTPLVAVIGASHDLPEESDIASLMDAFLIRLHVGPVSKESFPALIQLRGNATVEVPESLRLTLSDIAIIQAEAEKIAVPAEIDTLLADLRGWCESQQLVVSDRRWRRAVRLLQVSACTNGRDTVAIWDCWLLQHCLWSRPEERGAIGEWFAARVRVNAANDPSKLASNVASWECKLRADRENTSQKRDAKGTPLHRAFDGACVPDTRATRHATRGSEPLYLAPEGSQDPMGHAIIDRTNAGAGFTAAELDHLIVQTGLHRREPLVGYGGARDRAGYLSEPLNWLVEEVSLAPCMEPTRFTEEQVIHRIYQMDTLLAEIVAYKTWLGERIDTMEESIRAHLWISPGFLDSAARALRQTQREVESLFARTNKVRSAFEKLPRVGGNGGVSRKGAASR